MKTNNFNPFRMNTYRKMNDNSFVLRTYKKPGVGVPVPCQITKSCADY